MDWILVLAAAEAAEGDPTKGVAALADEVECGGRPHLVQTAPRRRDNVQYRISVYDNIASSPSTTQVTSPAHDPQAELDQILADLMVNISGLDQSLAIPNQTSATPGNKYLLT